MLHSKLVGSTLAILTLFALTACGGGGGSSTPTPTPVTYTISGTVAGLAGTGMVLQLNGANNLTVASGTTFAFPTAVSSGGAYSVTVLTQPSSPTQVCTVASGTGTATANVTNVAITCVTKYTIGGTVSGYSGSGLVLQLNAANNLTLASGVTTFAFPAAAAVNSGALYAVTVQTQPSSPAQTCTVTNGNGTASANVTNVAVVCTTTVTPTFTVGGTISGLTGTGLALTNNSGTPLVIAAAATTFTFPAQATGTAYAVAVSAQPASPAQSCNVTSNGTGTVAGANVTNVAISCATNDVVAPTVSGTLPINTTVGMDLLGNIVVDFSEALKPTSVTTSSFTLSANGTPVTGTVALSNGNARVTFDPGSTLAFDTTYTATLTTAIQDPSNNALAANYVWTFNTGKKIAAGGRHTCARLDGANNGKVKCWGRNLSGELGKGNSFEIGDEPNEMGAANAVIDFGTGRTAVQLEAGNDHTCARLDNGAVKCWGRNDRGQLGLGDTADRGYLPGQMGDALPAVVVGSGTVLQVMAGLDHNCVRFADGTIKCWGDNEYGQIGQDTAGSGLTATYTTAGASVALGAGLKAIDVEGFSRHNCARLVNASNVDQGMKCWGDNRWGQLGQGDTNNRGDNVNGMATVTALTFPGRTVRQVVATSGHSCVLLDNDTVRCWGNNWYGQVGKGVNGQVGGQNCTAADNCIGDVPGEVPGFVTVDLGLIGGTTPVELSGGDRHTCARLSTGKIKCWGENAVGQLGLGDTNNRGDAVGEMGVLLPEVNVGTAYVATEVSLGGFHSCAAIGTGVKCWGRNDFGQLGLGDTSDRGDGADMGDTLPLIDLTP